MLTEPQQRLFLKALAKAARIAREGGSGLVQLPVEGSDETETVEIGQEATRHLLDAYLDFVSTRMLDAMDAGQNIPEIDRQALVIWLGASVPDSQRN